MHLRPWCVTGAMGDDIDKIQFGVLSTDEIRALSVVEVVCHDMFEKGLPKHGGLSDLRLGSIDRQFNCHTCKNSAIECQGHYGHIELHHPVYHINFIKTVAKLLQCVCFGCYRCKVPFGDISNKTFKGVHEICKGRPRCIHCEHMQPKIICDKHDLYVEYESKRALSAGECRDILKRIPDEDVVHIGFSARNRPENMIFEVLMVPPPHVRPSVNMDSALRSQDDLTHKLCEIVKTNNLLKKTDTSSSSYQALCELLQYHVTTYIDNNTTGIAPATQRTGRPIKSITQRLKSKDGRVRGNLMGKRVNFSARTVITAEPNIDLDELGVPWEIAKTLTYPEVATPYNIRQLQAYVKAGPAPPFGTVGANFVCHDGVTKDLRFVKDILVEIGDTVMRHLKDGDVVVFNRQPSLHKMSMMGHKVRVMKHSTFRMNVSATTPYNADFDGDEMNLHAPQSLSSVAEIKELMMVSNNIVSPQSNKPVIGIIQDSLLSSFKMTHRDIFIPEHIFCDTLMKVRTGDRQLPQPAVVKPVRLYTGKQLIEMLLPEDLHFERKGAKGESDDSFFVDDGKVVIRNGRFIAGTLCKKSLGSSEGGLIHLLWLEYSPSHAKDFISNVQYVVNYWLVNSGFSIGAMDIFPSRETEELVRSTLDESKTKVSQIINICKQKGYDIQQYESKINQTLNNAMSQSGLLVKERLPDSNNINTTVTCGSKGSMFNIAQIMGCVGQQNVSGKRVDFGYIDRVLPHFERKDVGPAARGFVENSYKNGLKPHEFFYHAMGGREGIIDTAIKTSETGYIQRRLIKAMEDLSVGHDGSLRNAVGDVIQFVYGGDAFDPSRLRSVRLRHSAPGSADFAARFVHSGAPEAELDVLAGIMEKIGTTRNLKLPFDVDRIVALQKLPEIPISAADALALKEQLISDIRAHVRHGFVEYSNFYTEAYIHVGLCTKAACKRLDATSMRRICDTICTYFRRGLSNPGEMVGTVAAQSIGEPCTQLTLNTFHAAGISAKNVTLGVPRFKELINVAKTLKSPSMTLALQDRYATLGESDKVACELESLVLQDVVIECSILEIDLDTYTYMQIPDSLDVEYYRYGICYRLSRKSLADARLTLLDISVRIMQEFPSLHCIGVEDTMELHILVFADEGIEMDTIKMLNSKLKSEHIKGIPGLAKVYVSNDCKLLETDGTGLVNVIGCKYIDMCNSYSNDVLEVKEHLGIEAARALLLSEIKKVIEFDGTYVNMKHFLTLVDTMTHKGGLMSITRHGINKSENGPLMKCSFEETVDVLSDAAIFGEVDRLRGVTENITIGKTAKIGTGNVDILYDAHAQTGACAFTEGPTRPYIPLEVHSDEDCVSSYFTDDDGVDSYF